MHCDVQKTPRGSWENSFGVCRHRLGNYSRWDVKHVVTWCRAMDRHIDGWIHIVSKLDILILVGATAPVMRVVFGERRLPDACSSQYHSSSYACGLRWETASWCVFFSVSQLQLCVWSSVRGGFLLYVKVNNLRVNRIRRGRRGREISKHTATFCVDRCQSSSVTHNCQSSLNSLK